MEGIRAAVRDRVIREMLGSVIDNTGGGWKVLILDELTTAILSSSLKMSDLNEANVSTVEDIRKRREPLQLTAVYFIQPLPDVVDRLVADFAKGKAPLYPSVHIFFSSRVSADVVEKIKNCPNLVARLKNLKEANLEFMTVDSRTIVTGHSQALATLCGDKCEVLKDMYDREIESITLRLATVFATMNDYPSIRYKVGKPPEPGDLPGQTARSLLTQRVATKLTERVTVMQRAGALPAKETCDVLVLDRSFDPVAPFIHEWTYECLVYDLLDVDGNLVRYQSDSDVKQVGLEETDSVWVELRHNFIADVLNTLQAKTTEFKTKNKAAQVGGKIDTASLSTSKIRSVVQSMPQFQDVLQRLTLHTVLSSDITATCTRRQLHDLGLLEQQLVFGEKTSRDLISFLQEKQQSRAEAGKVLEASDKMRLFLCYLATHPDKMDGSKRGQWMKLAELSASDMNAICNLAYLGVSVMKQAGSGAKRLTFGSKKSKAVRKQREGPEDRYELSRFEPLLLDVVEEMAAGKLTAEEYPYVRAPEAPAPETTSAASARTNRSQYNWISGTASGATAASASAASGFGGAKGRRLYVVVVGGVSRGEVRTVHRLSRDLKRDIVLCSTSVDRPARFLDALRTLSSGEDLLT